MRTVALLLVAASATASVTLGPPLRLPRHPPARVLDVPILMYHRVGPLPSVRGPFSAALTVQPGVFAAQMTWLARHGFHAIRPRRLFDALEWGSRLPRRPVLITFDDGYTDVLWHAEPVLHRLDWPATAFVITDRVGGTDPSFLDWRDLRDLERDGFTIGSHTVHHLDLTALSSAEAWLELSQSRDDLVDHLHKPVDWFAYPAGRENRSVVRLVRKAGYLLAMTTRLGFRQSAREPFLLRRDEIMRSDGLAGFAALLHSAP
jgi:peptidoglycan/xylan/chitin deacetylase (PgdA/CDA1 family)